MTLPFTIYHRRKIVAKCSSAEDAWVLCDRYGTGSVIRHGRTLLWRQGFEYHPDMFDIALGSRTIRSRINSKQHTPNKEGLLDA